MALVSAAIVIAYAALLPRDNLPSSAPALGAVLLASTLSSIAGFAFSAICGVMLLHMMSDPLQVVETMMVCSIAIQSLSVAALWCDVEWRELLKFLAGGTIGLPFGVWLLLNLGHVGFREAVGTLLTAYAAYALLKRPVTIRSGGNLVDACVGFLGGITGDRWTGWLSRRLGDDLVRHARLGQAAPARSLPTLHPAHAGLGAFADPDHAPLRNTERRSEPRATSRVCSGGPTRHVVRPRDLQASV
jgi:uncharacterized membrane protein (DUF2068 family)